MRRFLLLVALPLARPLALVPVAPHLSRIVEELTHVEPRVARRRSASCHKQSVLQQLHDQCCEARAADAAEAAASWTPPTYSDAQELAVALAHNGAPPPALPGTK